MWHRDRPHPTVQNLAPRPKRCWQFRRRRQISAGWHPAKRSGARAPAFAKWRSSWPWGIYILYYFIILIWWSKPLNHGGMYYRRHDKSVVWSVKGRHLTSLFRDCAAVPRIVRCHNLATRWPHCHNPPASSCQQSGSCVGNVLRVQWCNTLRQWLQVWRFTSSQQKKMHTERSFLWFFSMLHPIGFWVKLHQRDQRSTSQPLPSECCPRRL